MDIYPKISDKTFETISRLSDILIEKNEFIGFAESCTSGLLAAFAGAIPGASKWYKGSIVSYASTVKEDVLLVNKDIITKLGAVSSECAKNMAIGAAKALNVDLSVSVTGVAGPDTDEFNNPVGLVFIGVCYKGNTRVNKYYFNGNRLEIRKKATEQAIEDAFSFISNID